MRCKSVATAALGAALLAGIAAMLVHHRHDFTQAVETVPLVVLLTAAVLHVGTVVARTAAWAVSVRAAGAATERRALFQIASLGFAANVISGSLGTAVRIWALRRKGGANVPSAPALVAAEVPVLSIQLILTGFMAFSLSGPLGAPWWTAPAVLAVAIAVLLTLVRAGRRFRGLAALRDGRACWRMLAMVVVVAACETARNLILLRAVGLPADAFDAIALLVGAGAVGVLPIGPGSTAGAAMLIFGASGVGPAAAAGLLLTATGFAADLAYAGWGLGDILWRACPKRARRAPRMVDLGAALGLMAAAAVVMT
jgi:uncharacterized membrane protein YbhN (UPF0104 family)